MTKTSQQYEYMKDGVIEFYFLDAVNNCTSCISNTPGKKPEQTLCRQAVNQRRDRKNDNPPHEHIHQG